MDRRTNMNSSNLNRMRTGALALAAALLSACALTGATPSATEEHFGESVRHMVEHQKANPEASRNPDPNPIMEGDGPRLESVLETYRSDTGQPAEVERDILIDIGQ